MPKRTLSVVCNPYLAHDSAGRPCAVVMRVDTPRPEPVGATVKGADAETGELIYAYSFEPITLADHPTHRRLLATGQLLPADEPTARLAGVAYVSFPKALDDARHAAAERHLAETGEPSPHLIPVLSPKAPSAPATTKES